MRKDSVAGLGLIGAGGLYALYAVATLPIGSLTQMGPGMFPLGLGVLLSIFGASLLVPAFGDSEKPLRIDWRILGTVLASIAAFALLIRPAGLLPAVFATAIIASFSMPQRKYLTTLILCVVLSVLIWFVFIFLLSIRIPLIQWRF